MRRRSTTPPGPEGVEQLFELLEQYGDNILRKAIDLAVSDQVLSVAGVRRGVHVVTARDSASDQLLLRAYDP